MLQTIFSNFGAVESARVLSHKNCGFVNFERTEDAVKARKAMNGQEISGSVVRIGFAKVPPRGESGSKSTRTIPAVPLSVMGIPSAPWSSEDAPEAEEVKVVSPTTVSPTVRFAPDLNGVDTELSIIDKGLLLSLDDKLLAFPYASYLPPLPDSSHIKLDQNRLREIRKRLDSHPNPKDIENAFNELEPVFVELCTDYIGNTVVQKLMDKGNEAQRLRLIEKVAPFLAPIGVHKNGTWAVQKIIDSATTPAQIHHIINYLKPFVPPLMLDQFGNYVIQGCLKYGPEYNQFIYDAIHSRCWEICQGRFGARAVRTCLESNFVTKRQQRLVSVALAHSSLLLSTDPNGSLLLTWLLDTSNIYGRFKALVPQFSLHLPQLCTHKLATLTILKIINQRFEPDARSELIKSLFFSSDSVLEIVLGDQAHGMGLIQKILASACIEEDEREKIVERVREAAIKLELNQIQGYHHFMEQLGVPTSPNSINWQSNLPSANNGTSPDSPRIDQQQQA
jgi:protein JSN1